MSEPITRYLYHKFNRQTADFWAEAPGAKFRVHLGNRKKTVSLDILDCELTEPSDPGYVVWESADLAVIDNADGSCSIPLIAVEFDFGDGPVKRIKSNWLWVSYLADAIAEFPMLGVQLPETVDFDDDLTRLTFDLEVRFGALDPTQSTGPAACPVPVTAGVVFSGDAVEPT